MCTTCGLTSDIISAHSCTGRRISAGGVGSCFKRKCRCRIACAKGGLPTLIRSFCMCPTGSCILASFALRDAARVTSGCVTPIGISQVPRMLGRKRGGHTLFVPFSGSY